MVVKVRETNTHVLTNDRTAPTKVRLPKGLFDQLIFIYQETHTKHVLGEKENEIKRKREKSQVQSPGHVKRVRVYDISKSTSIGRWSLALFFS